MFEGIAEGLKKLLGRGTVLACLIAAWLSEMDIFRLFGHMVCETLARQVVCVHDDRDNDCVTKWKSVGEQKVD